MKFSTLSIFIIFLSFIYSSCNNIDFKKTRGGVPYKIFPSSKGDKVLPGGFVKYMMVIKVRDSVVRSSYTGMPEYEQVGEARYYLRRPTYGTFAKVKGWRQYLLCSGNGYFSFTSTGNGTANTMEKRRQD